MLNNFIYAKQKSLFEEKLNAGEVLDEAIVFIEDTKEIWNHGTYFDCKTFDPSLLETSIANKADKATTLSGYGISDVNIDLDTVGSPVSIQIGNKDAELTTINDDFVAINNSLTLGRFGYNNWGVPYSTASQHGVVKIGEGLTCDEDGVVSSALSLQDTTASLDEIPSDVYVKYVAQTLTDAQKAQVRSNIGVESFTQTQSDWSVTDSSSAAFIKNKPTIPTKISQLSNDEGYLKAGSGDGTMFLSNDGTYKTVSTDVPIQKLTFREYDELTLQPNIYYELSARDIMPACSLVINFASNSNTNVISQYVFQIDLTTVPGGATLTMPSVKWSNGIAPTFEAAIYQISIVNGLATWQKFVATNTGQ